MAPAGEPRLSGSGTESELPSEQSRDRKASSTHEDSGDDVLHVIPEVINRHNACAHTCCNNAARKARKPAPLAHTQHAHTVQYTVLICHMQTLCQQCTMAGKPAIKTLGTAACLTPSALYLGLCLRKVHAYAWAQRQHYRNVGEQSAGSRTCHQQTTRHKRAWHASALE